MIQRGSKRGRTALDEISICCIYIIYPKNDDSTMSCLHGSGFSLTKVGGKVVGSKQFKAREARLEVCVCVVIVSIDHFQPHNIMPELKGCRKIVDQQAKVIQFHVAHSCPFLLLDR